MFCFFYKMIFNFFTVLTCGSLYSVPDLYVFQICMWSRSPRGVVPCCVVFMAHFLYKSIDCTPEQFCCRGGRFSWCLEFSLSVHIVSREWKNLCVFICSYFPGSPSSRLHLVVCSGIRHRIMSKRGHWLAGTLLLQLFSVSWRNNTDSELPAPDVRPRSARRLKPLK